MGIVSYLENLVSTYLITCIFYVYYICQAEILMICLKWLEYMNKNYVQTNQYLENKSGYHKNLDAQKGEWYHRKVKGDFTEVVILKDIKNTGGRD